MNIKDFFRRRKPLDLGTLKPGQTIEVNLNKVGPFIHEWLSYNNCVFRRYDISCIIKCHDGTADFILRNGKYIVSKMRYDRLLKALRIVPADLNQLYKQTNTKDHE